MVRTLSPETPKEREMTRAEVRRSEKEMQKAQRAEALKQEEQRKNAVRASRRLTVSEGSDSDANATQQEYSRRGVIYLRVSSEAQDGEDKVSISEQRIACYEYCARNGITVVEEFCDIAPGRQKDRPAFQRMFALIREGNVDVVVCWKGDRLARSVSAANALLEALEGTDTELEATHESIDRKYFVLLAWFGGMELENLRLRTMSGKRGRARAGKIPSRSICYGYDVDEKGFPVVNEDQARVVQYIYQLYVEEGLGMVKIRDRLNAEGVPSARGVQWGYGMVNGVLRHAAYMGTWDYGKTRWEHLESGMRKTKQPEEHIIEVEVPKIIDEATWHRAQQLRAERSVHSTRNTKIFYLLQHKMHCDACGRMMGCRTDKRRTVREDGKFRGEKVENSEHYGRYYLCYGQQRDGYKCRRPANLRAQTIEDAVWDATAHILRNPEEFIATDESELADDKRQALEVEIRKVQRRLDDELKARKFILRRGSLGMLSEREMDEQVVIIRESIEQHEEFLSDLLEQENMAAMEQEQRGRLEAYLLSIGDVIDDLSDEQRRELIRHLYTRISIDGENRIMLTVALPGSSTDAIAI